MNFKNKQKGFIKMIIIIVIAIAVLSWYGVDIKEFITSEPVQRNFTYVWSLWIQYIWEPFMNVLKIGERA